VRGSIRTENREKLKALLAFGIWHLASFAPGDKVASV
jgi:hypothetical protein